MRTPTYEQTTRRPFRELENQIKRTGQDGPLSTLTISRKNRKGGEIALSVPFNATFKFTQLVTMFTRLDMFLGINQDVIPPLIPSSASAAPESFGCTATPLMPVRFGLAA